MIKIFILRFIFFCFAFELVQGQEINKIEGKITYLTADQIFCDLGSIRGAAVGDTLKIFRRNLELGLIVVTNLARNSAVCASLTPTSLFQLGDRAVLEKHTLIDIKPPDSKLKEKVRKTEIAVKKRNWTHSGNLSIRFASTQFTNNKSALREIGTLNYRLGAEGSLNPQLWVYGRGDLRAKTFSIYQARLSFGSKSALFYLQAGRVFSPELSGVGATDGILLAARIKKGITLGVLGGYQPDPFTLKFNVEMTKVGAFLSLIKKSSSFNMNGSIALALQKAGGRTDREFIYWKWRGELSRKLILAVNQTLDLYTGQTVGRRKAVTPTSSQASLSYRPVKGLIINSRYSGRRQVIYLESGQYLPDSLFQDALRYGWYNGISWASRRLGILQMGLNLRIQKSSDRNAMVIFFGWGTPASEKNSSFDFKTHFIRNELLTGVKYTIRSVQTFRRFIYLNLGYEIYTYGYGNNYNDYIQQRFNAGLNWPQRSRFHLSLSTDYTLEKEKGILFLYGGFNLRF